LVAAAADVAETAVVGAAAVAAAVTRSYTILENSLS